MHRMDMGGGVFFLIEARAASIAVESAPPETEAKNIVSCGKVRRTSKMTFSKDSEIFPLK